MNRDSNQSVAICVYRCPDIFFGRRTLRVTKSTSHKSPAVPESKPEITVNVLGVIVRNCAAFGAHGLIVGETCSTPYLRRSVRNSMGTIFKLPVLEPRSLLETLGRLRDGGIRCVAAHGPARSLPLAQASLAGDCCIVLGSEGYGLSEGVLAACDQQVSIPMANSVDSLNVGNAAAVFLYEANRQRGTMGG